ncbi:general substrate transporter [Phascolomyces articulosus]|uniref:General substrate transporter n=1 Tax=Phascolomyces articulosus TaxID=60185 RepID=A0AAD5KEG0_9FUNG|nr:general substrate transporter [Phascolomyces articulosus]
MSVTSQTTVVDPEVQGKTFVDGDQVGFRKGVYLSSIVAAVGGFLISFDTGATSGVLTMIPFRERFFNENNIDNLQELLLALYLMTATLGSFFSALFCDHLSRKYTIVFATVLFCIGNIFIVIGYNYGLLLAGRLVAGFGAGLLTNGIPLYHSEIAPPDIRGRLISFFTLMNTFGQVVGYFLTFGTSYLITNWSWRAPYLLQSLLSVLFGISMLFMPFSPRWLVDKGRIDDALATLAILRNTTNVQAEFNEIREEIEYEHSLGKRTYVELLSHTNRKRFFSASFVSIATAFTGIVAIWYYSPQIFQTAGLSDVSSSIAATGGTGILSFVCTAISLQWVVDTWGRKKLFVSGSVIMSISMFIIGALFEVYTTVDSGTGKINLQNTGARNTIIAFIYIFDGAYSFTWGITNYIYPAEVFNMRTRAKGLALTYGFFWAFSIMVTYCVPLFSATSVSGVYFFFGACQVVAMAGLWFLPETKGKTLEEMEYIFGAR